MVGLPLFKLGSLLVRHVSKYGANLIKAQAHDHPKFRAVAARYGQHIHQFQMRLSVAAIRSSKSSVSDKPREPSPGSSTGSSTGSSPQSQSQSPQSPSPSSPSSPSQPSQSTSTLSQETKSTPTAAPLSPSSPTSSSPTPTPSSSSSPSTTAEKADASKPKRSAAFPNIWKRRFRALPEPKAVDLFADFVGDSFILSVAVLLLVVEWVRSSQKPDHNALKIQALEDQVRALQLAEAEQRERIRTVEQSLDAQAKKPSLLPRLTALTKDKSD